MKDLYIELGSLPDWISAFSTLLAAAIALIAYINWRRPRKTEYDDIKAKELILSFLAIQSRVKDLCGPALTLEFYKAWNEKASKELGNLRLQIAFSKYWFKEFRLEKLYKDKIEKDLNRLYLALNHFVADSIGKGIDQLMTEDDESILYSSDTNFHKELDKHVEEIVNILDTKTI